MFRWSKPQIIKTTKKHSTAAKKAGLICLAVFAALLCAVLFGLDDSLSVTYYSLKSDTVGKPIRVALITDLHSCDYGKDMRELTDMIDVNAPDLILLGGDIFDDELPDDNAAVFLRYIGSRYPCCYVTGNHEYWSGETAFDDKMSILNACGIKRLSGEMETIAIGGNIINICGVDDPYAWAEKGTRIINSMDGFEDQLRRVSLLPRNGHCTLLLTHRPELAKLYAEYGYDLVLTGHAHGGQWRIPRILNGLYAPDQGFFPAYAGGKYSLDDMTMIVSRGLSRESTSIPRLYNPPELVIIDIA